MFKKKKKEIFIEEDERFIIYQMSFPREVNKHGNIFTPSKVASPSRGSKVPNRIVYHDNKGQRDVDYNYDYARTEENKHLTEEDEIKRFGRKYHEFQILNNEEIAKIAGTDIPKPDPKVEVTNEVVIDNKKKDDSFITSIDELMDYIELIDDDIFVIGGASIYELLLPYCNMMFLTHIEQKSEADVFFPKINNDEWERNLINTSCDNNIQYKQYEYKRIKQTKKE